MRFFAPLWLAACALLGLLLLAPRAWALDVPALTTRVNDQAGLLTDADRQRIEARLAGHEQRSGQQFAVLIIPSLEGEPVEAFSLRVVESWKLGKKGKDEGLLLLIAAKDRKMRIEVGYGLEGVITDALSSRVIRETLTPAFRSQDYAGGIDRALVRLIRAAGGDPGAEPAPAAAPRRERRSRLPVGFIISLILFPLIVWALNRGGGGGGRGRRRGGLYMGGVYWGGGGGSFRGGGGGGGFGGFSGGGGGFGGGGASGSW
jgi:uncharacterized protein